MATATEVKGNRKRSEKRGPFSGLVGARLASPSSACIARARSFLGSWLPSDALSHFREHHERDLVAAAR
jgi:hypothetical protein